MIFWVFPKKCYFFFLVVEKKDFIFYPVSFSWLNKTKISLRKKNKGKKVLKNQISLKFQTIFLTVLGRFI